MSDRPFRNQHFSLVADNLVPIRSLASFQKHMTIPTESNHSTSKFVAQLAQKEIDLEADRLFESAKQAFQLKRRQIEFQNVDTSICCLATPQFRAELSAHQDEQLHDHVVFSRRINDFEDLNLIGSDEFNSFASARGWKIRLDFSAPVAIVNLIDYFENQDSNLFDLKYKRSLDWLRLDFPDVGDGPCSLRFTEVQAEIGSNGSVEPRELITQYIQVCEALASMKGPAQSWQNVFASCN